MRQGVRAKRSTRTQEAEVKNLAAEALRIASAFYQQSPDWVVFLREILGANGVVRQLFPSQELLAQFEGTSEYREIQKMITELRSRPPERTPRPRKERTRMITVRVPESLHAMLQTEAHALRTSVNQLCIAKLLRLIDNEAGDEEGSAPSK